VVFTRSLVAQGLACGPAFIGRYQFVLKAPLLNDGLLTSDIGATADRFMVAPRISFLTVAREAASNSLRRFEPGQMPGRPQAMRTVRPSFGV
jgi:hypothetical protein